jgi:hypothetical protein
MMGVHKEIKKMFGTSVQNRIISSRTIQGRSEAQECTEAERQEIISRWHTVKPQIDGKGARPSLGTRLSQTVEAHLSPSATPKRHSYIGAEGGRPVSPAGQTQTAGASSSLAAPPTDRPPVAALDGNDDDEEARYQADLSRAIAASLAQDEQPREKKAEDPDDEVILEYIKRQSAAEEEYRRARQT